MKLGRAGTMTHDYKRNGTTDLLAALNIATGEVITECAIATPPTTCSRSSSGSIGRFPAASRSTSCWTTSRPTWPPPSQTGSPSASDPMAPALHAHELLRRIQVGLDRPGRLVLGPEVAGPRGEGAGEVAYTDPGG